jgi:hypothetical protein
MPPKKKQKKSALKTALAGLGLGGAYTKLINKAIRNDWDAQEFVVALTRTKEFKRRYPGLVVNGRINDFLAGGRDGVTVSNLGSAVTNYKRLRESYQDVVQAQGLGGRFAVTPKNMRKLIKGEVSPEEFGQRALITNAVQKDPSLEAWYNAVRKQAGLKPVDRFGLMKDISNKQSRFYDLHEAARLGASGLYGAKDALSLARSLGTPGQYKDVGELVQAVKANLADIGPEVARAGIDNVTFAKFLDNPASDLKGELAQKLQTILANRRALGQQQVQNQGARGPGGGLSLYPEGEARSY